MTSATGKGLEARGVIAMASSRIGLAEEQPKAYKNVERYESPNKARIIEKPSIASASSFQLKMRG